MEWTNVFEEDPSSDGFFESDCVNGNNSELGLQQKSAQTDLVPQIFQLCNISAFGLVFIDEEADILHSWKTRTSQALLFGNLQRCVAQFEGQIANTNILRIASARPAMENIWYLQDVWLRLGVALLVIAGHL